MPQAPIAQESFINNTDLDEKEARSLIGRLSALVEKSETNFNPFRVKAEDSLRIIRNELWTEEDKKFFDQFDISPYQIPEARAPFNRLFGQQRMSRYDFDIIPEDQHAFERHRRNRDEFVEKHGHEFNSVSEAEEYFDKYADDELAESVTVYLDKYRNRTNAKHNESQVFENGVITGADLFKSVFSVKNNPDGQIERERRNIRQMFWDINSVDYFLSDVEYIGEVQRYYKHEMISLWPHLRDQIEHHFSQYSNMNRHSYVPNKQSVDWKDFYKFDNVNDEPQLKIVELWHIDIEERVQLYNIEEDDTRLIQFGFDEDEIYDRLYVHILDEMEEEVQNGELSPDFLSQTPEQIRAEVERIADERYELRPTQVPVWYKTVFSHNAIFEHIRSPLPHNSHPYTPFFPQFTDGWWTSVVDDVKDVVLALNKAVMFRELIQAHSAKGVLVVDKKTIQKSGYSMDDIREQWTEIGAVIDLDLAGGRRLGDVFTHINTMHDGLQEITLVINELKSRLYEIIGVNDAMMGAVSNEASGSQLRQRITQGAATNGILYDNFNASLEYHIKHKEIPLIAHEMYVRRPKAIRKLGAGRGEWIEWTHDEDFDLFVDTLRRGDFTFRLRPKETDSQINQQQSAMLMQVAMAGGINVETALEFSDMPFAHRLLRRDKEITRRKQAQALQNQIDIEQVSQMAMEMGVDVETADELQRRLRLQRSKELKEQEGRQRQMGQGMGEIQSQANEANRQEQIINSTQE